MDGPAERSAVWVVADQHAVADAVSQALVTAGFRIITSVEDVAAERLAGPCVGLLLHALAPDLSVAAARQVLAGAELPWLVVASTPRDHGWGAAYDAGAALVVDASETSVECVVALLGSLSGDAGPAGAGDHQDLVDAWHHHVSRH